MSTDNLDELKNLFIEASGLDDLKRRQFIQNLRDQNAQLAEQLVQLLAYDTPTADNISNAIQAVTDDVGNQQNPSRVGHQLGPYRLIEKIGQGGMGAVYRADRSDGEFEHQVAIKLIGTHSFSPDMVERFRNERQILARLNHPNIASILDGGTTDNGTTYLVMELIDGLSVIQFCTRNKLTVKQRLKLFLDICNAIEYAHQNLIVHRDIKPSNILVTRDGTPKLLDFGIAKLIEPDLHKESPATVVAVTPDYSSPEQILGQPVTTSCDVYSLGVLLFEMLTDKRPYQRQGKLLSQIEREIQDTAPPKPSQALRQSDARSTRARTLSGDLDTIVLASLRREPKDRYQSVNALATDIDNYLTGKPITAKSRSLGYVARKFLLRNRWPAALTAAVLVAVTSATTFHIKSIATERDLVLREAQKSAAVTKYLENLFEITEPNQTNGEAISAVDVLDRGTRRLNAELADQPEVRARLLTSIGVVYNNLGLRDKGIETTEKAIEIQRSTDASPQMLLSLASLARMHRERGDFNASREALDDAVRLSKQLNDSRIEEFTWVLLELGEVNLIEGKYEEAQGFYSRTLELLDELPAHDPSLSITALAATGQTYQLKGDPDNAERYMRQALLDLNELDYDIPTQTAAISHNLATLLHELGRYDEAEPLYLTALDIEQRVISEDHEDIDVVLTNIGRLYKDMREFEAAEVYLQMAVDHVRELHGEEHFFTAYNSKNLADLLSDKKDYAAAEELYDQVLATYKLTLETDSPYFASVQLARANLFVATARNQDAVEAARDGLRICALGLPDDHWLTATTKSSLAEALVQLDGAAEAEELLLDAWDVLLAVRPEHKTTRKVANQLGDLYKRNNNNERSLFFTQQARELEKL